MHHPCIISCSYQLMDECCAATSTTELRLIITRCAAYRDGGATFVFDHDKERRQKEAAKRRKLERQKRKTFESRMVRKVRAPSDLRRVCSCVPYLICAWQRRVCSCVPN
jgi:hypothetical protein